MSSSEVDGAVVADNPRQAVAGRSVAPRRRFFLQVFYLSQLGILLGVIAGLVWGLTAPRSQITGVEGGKVSFDPMSSAPIGADMTFMLIAVIGAVALTAFIYKIARDRPLAALFGVLIGSALGTLAMFLIGSLVANLGIIDPTQLEVGATTDAPLEIEATGVFYVWTFWSAILMALIYWGRSRSLAREIKQLQLPQPPPPEFHMSGEPSRASTQE